MMTRTAAREIAVHYAFELSFSDLSAQTLLEQELIPDALRKSQRRNRFTRSFPERNS